MANTSETIQIRYFSGYIRNWKSLCDELKIALPLSRKEREAEIIKKAYEKWGLKLPEHLYGAFVIAVEDKKENKVVCFRDQVGQKHMFYTVADGELLCSGDINELASNSRVEKRLNKSMLQQYLFYGYPIGKETFYEGIFKLLPGHYLVWDGNTLNTTRYWKPVFEPDYEKTADEFAEDIRAVINEIFEEERSDTELPYKESFLSGGVDSSYLLAASDAVCANTVGYEEAGFDESALARHTAEVLGKGFRVKMIDAEEFFERIPEVMDKIGQPLGDASAVAFSLGCAAVREHAGVVYSGEGIDEFFGGYNAHKRHIPDDWTYLTCSHIMNEEVVKSIMTDYDESVKAVAPIEKLWRESEGMDELARKLVVDISLWLEGDIYLNTDRTSTACGIELHTPFSDLRLFNVARKIPSSLAFNGEQNKYVFRKAANSKLPDEVAFRKKVGFPVPIRNWMSDERFTKRIEDKLFGKSSEKLFNQDELRKMWTSYLNGDSILWNRIYAIYVFLLWHDVKFSA